MMNMPVDQLEKLEMQSGGVPGPRSAIGQEFDNGGIDPIMNQFLQDVYIPGQGQDMRGANMKDMMTLNKMKEQVEINQSGGRELKFGSKR
jgi:hypothetical protein